MNKLLITFLSTLALLTSSIKSYAEELPATVEKEEPKKEEPKKEDAAKPAQGGAHASPEANPAPPAVTPAPVPVAPVTNAAPTLPKVTGGKGYKDRGQQKATETKGPTATVQGGGNAKSGGSVTAGGGSAQRGTNAAPRPTGGGGGGSGRAAAGTVQSTVTPLPQDQNGQSGADDQSGANDQSDAAGSSDGGGDSGGGGGD